MVLEESARGERPGTKGKNLTRHPVVGLPHQVYKQFLVLGDLLSREPDPVIAKLAVVTHQLEICLFKSLGGLVVLGNPHLETEG